MCKDHFLHFHQTRSARPSSSTESHSWSQSNRTSPTHCTSTVLSLN